MGLQDRLILDRSGTYGFKSWAWVPGDALSVLHEAERNKQGDSIRAVIFFCQFRCGGLVNWLTGYFVPWSRFGILTPVVLIAVLFESSQ